VTVKKLTSYSKWLRNLYKY